MPFFVGKQDTLPSSLILSSSVLEIPLQEIGSIAREESLLKNTIAEKLLFALFYLPPEKNTLITLLEQTEKIHKIEHDK